MTDAATDHLLSCAQMRALGLYVPATLELLEDAFGPPTLHNVVRRIGGQRVFVPTPAHLAGSQLERVVGASVAHWATREIGPGVWIVPLGPRSNLARAITAIIATKAREGDASINRIADATGLCVRSVERHQQRLRKHPAAVAAIAKELAS